MNSARQLVAALSAIGPLFDQLDRELEDLRTKLAAEIRNGFLMAQERNAAADSAEADRLASLEVASSAKDEVLRLQHIIAALEGQLADQEIKLKQQDLSLRHYAIMGDG